MPTGVMPRIESGIVSRTSSARCALSATICGGFVSMSEIAFDWISAVTSSCDLPSEHIEYAIAIAWSCG